MAALFLNKETFTLHSGLNLITYHRPAVDGDDIWFSSLSDNCLYRFNFIKNEFLRVGYIYPNSGNILYSDNIKINNEIFFIPFYSTIIEL